ncbi:MAG: hypothetical protein Kow0059_12670 [Candidatus Sumerlaeia bacterium]
MTNRKLAALAVTAVVLLAATIVLYSGEGKAGDTFAPGGLLIQGLDPERIHTIVIKTNNSEVTLQRQGRQFTVAGKHNYPASVQRVNDLLIAALEIRCASLVTKTAANHKELGVEEGGADATVVKFLDKDGNLLTGLVRGKNVEGGGGQYVRRLGEDTVYASEKWVSLNTSDQNYLDTELTNIPQDKIARVEVSTPAGTYSIARNEDKDIVLQDIPAGKQPKGKLYESVFRAGANLRFTDVKPAADMNIAWNNTFTMELDSGLKYIVKSAKKDGKAWLALAAEAPPLDRRITISADESKEELEKKEEKVKAADSAKTFNERHGNWVYEVGDWYMTNLTKSLDDLLEDRKDAAAPQTPAAATPTQPEFTVEGDDNTIEILPPQPESAPAQEATPTPAAPASSDRTKDGESRANEPSGENGSATDQAAAPIQAVSRQQPTAGPPASLPEPSPIPVEPHSDQSGTGTSTQSSSD